MSKKLLHAVALLVFALIYTGCSHSASTDPVVPSAEITSTELPSLTNSGDTSGRYFLGFWTVEISPDLQTVEILPWRDASMHLNVLKFLEAAPCSDCLKLGDIRLLSPENYHVELLIKHPVPNVPKLTVFDVRSILITGSDYSFPESGLDMAWGDEFPKLTNADGYTSLFNPTDYPPGSPLPDALEYFRGRMARGGNFTATLNPYKAFGGINPGSRLYLSPSESCWRDFLDIYIPSGEPLRFGYAIDASWMWVEGQVEIYRDFPIEANCPEAYLIEIKQWNVLPPDPASHATIQAVVYDHQGLDTIESVKLEAPDIFIGEVELEYVDESGYYGYLYTGEITNAKSAPQGLYPLLVTVTDKKEDPSLGPVYAYQVFPLHVANGWLDTWQTDTNGSLLLDVEVDSRDDIYVSGLDHIQWHGDTDLDPSPEKVRGYGTYLSKFNSRGELIWCRSWPALGAYAIAFDSLNNVYVTGAFELGVDFDPGPGEDYHESFGVTDIFLSKYDSEGNYIWTRTWGGSEGGGTGWLAYALSEVGLDVAVASDDTVYICGAFEGRADFDPGPDVYELEAVSGNDSFLCQLDPDGNFLWAVSWGGDEQQGTYDDRAQSVATYPPNIVYVSGLFGSPVDFDPGPEAEEHEGDNYDKYLVKYESNEFQWVDVWSNHGYTISDPLDVDEHGDIYVTGMTQMNGDLDPGDGIITGPPWSGYLSKFNPGGDLQWVALFHQPEDESGDCLGWSVNAVNSGNICVSGSFCGTIDFDPTVGGSLHTYDPGPGNFATNYAGFICLLTSEGAFNWARTIGDTSARWLACDVVSSDSHGRIYTAGMYAEHRVDFDPGEIEELRDRYKDGPSYLMMIPPDGNW